MTQERDDDPGTQLVVKQTSIDSPIESSLVEKMGFSTRLASNLRQLNEVLSKINPRLRDMEIELTPDVDAPLIKTAVTYERGYKVKLTTKVIFGGARRLGRPMAVDSQDYDSRLDIFSTVARDESPYFLKLTLGDIQEFVASTLPNKRALLIGIPDIDRTDKADTFERDIATVTEEILEPLLELREYPIDALGNPNETGYGGEFKEYKVTIEGQEEPLLTVLLDLLPAPPKTGKSELVAASVLRIIFHGRPQEAENMVLSVSQLFDKPPLYPINK